MVRTLSLFLLFLPSGCHLVFGHAPAASKSEARVADAVADAPRADGVTARDRAVEAVLPTADLRADRSRDRGADAAKADKAAPDKAKADNATPSCKVDGTCSAGESCAAGCADCCGCGEADCGAAGTTCVTTGGAFATAAGAWQVKPAIPLSSVPYPGTGKVRLNLCGLSLGGVTFTGTSPLNTADRGAYAAVGLAANAPTVREPAQAIWFVVTSTMPSTQTSWDGQPATHDQKYRKYLFQTYYRGAGPVGVLSLLGHQYNVEKGSVAGSKYLGADVLDLRLEVTPKAAGVFSYQAWARLKLSSATVDGCPYLHNTALNNTAPAAAWVLLRKHSLPSKDDYETSDALSWGNARAYLWAYNGASASNTSYPITWTSASLQLIP